VPVPYTHLEDGTLELRRLHDLYIANNLILADFNQLGLYVHKFSHYSRMSKAGHYTHGEWQRLYAQGIRI
jgi:hypothetical protein